MQRLTGVPRATRQSWANAGLLGKQSSPFSLMALREAVALSELRSLVGAHAEVAYTQLRPDLSEVADRPPPIEAIVDLVTGGTEWFSGGEQLVAAARFGNPVQLVDMTRRLSNAKRGFDLIVQAAAAAAEAAPDDELTKHRTRARTPRRSRGSRPAP